MLGGARIVDLTHHLADDMTVHPLLPRPSFEDVASVRKDGYAMSEYRLFNHIGTHVDAPSHHVADGPTLDDIALDRLVTPAIVLDFSARVPGPISLEEMRPHLPRLQPGDMVLINSGNGGNWGSEAYWSGWSYPGEDAAKAMVERAISGVGFDGPSADPTESTTFPLHKIWCGAGCLILENVANLGELPERTLLVIAPMKVRGANGAPARLLALVSGSL